MGTPMNNETIDKRLKIFSERANAVTPEPITREEIVASLAKTFRVAEREADELVTCYEISDDERARELVFDFLSRDSFMEEQS